MSLILQCISGGERIPLLELTISNNHVEPIIVSAGTKEAGYSLIVCAPIGSLEFRGISVQWK